MPSWTVAQVQKPADVCDPITQLHTVHSIKQH